jgi:hypothetical protein
MRHLTIAVIAATLSSVAPASAAPPQRTQQIRGEGCVEPGPEARCLVVKDLKSGSFYNLIFKGLQPEIGSGVAFSGVPHNGVTTCMRGSPIDVQAWSRKDSLKCTQGTAPHKSR